jgi:hypothetical protein
MQGAEHGKSAFMTRGFMPIILRRYARIWHETCAQLGAFEGPEAAALPTFAPESPGWINLIHAHLWDNDAAN